PEPRGGRGDPGVCGGIAAAPPGGRAPAGDPARRPEDPRSRHAGRGATGRGRGRVQVGADNHDPSGARAQPDTRHRDVARLPDHSEGELGRQAFDRSRHAALLGPTAGDAGSPPVTRGPRGFTLLEVLIALAIVGALLVIALGGMRVALGAWRQGEDRAGLGIPQRARPHRNPFTEAEVAFHDPTVTSLALGYMDESGSFRDAWDGAQDKTLPRAVRITVSTTLNGQTQTLPPLTVSLH